MVLNHSSLQGFKKHQVLAQLSDLAVGMAELVDKGVTTSAYRTTKHEHETECMAGESLFDAFLALKSKGLVKESLFLMRLATKCPIFSETLCGLWAHSPLVAGTRSMGRRVLRSRQQRHLTPSSRKPTVTREFHAPG